jgi:hypothetical protein
MNASLIPIARLDALSDDTPAHAEADGIDLAAGLVAAGLVSVLVFPAVAVALLSRVAQPVAP